MPFWVTIVVEEEFSALGLLLFAVAHLFAFGVCILGFRFLFVFHAAILEPDLDLTLGQSQIVRYLNPTTSGEIFVEVELFFQFERLMPAIRLSASLFLCFGFNSGSKSSNSSIYHRYKADVERFG